VDHVPSTQTQPSKSEAPIQEVAAPTDTAATAKWDQATTVKADFNSDGVPDEAVVGYVDDGLLLAIDTGRSDGAKIRSLMSFGIGQSQDSICAAPATLRVEMACEVDGEQLPGCRPTKEPSGLALGDRSGDCDSIHLYWDHEENRMAWWRN
jgi:hypothetical protein